MSDRIENTQAIAQKTVAELAAKLPEIYQPIYGHPELSNAASRACEDRLTHILHIYKLLESKLGRPLRVLDLGCAQGFFGFHLAKHGASVIGVDFLEANIDLCNKLAAENESYDVHFSLARVEHVAQNVLAEQIDLVLALSVFHHIVHASGAEFVRGLLGKLAERIPAGIYEMALDSEPPYWAPSQPKDPRQLLEPYAFVHEMGRYGTHLSAIQRPLYVASNHFWFLGDSMGAFDNHQRRSHALNVYAAQSTRRYFFGEGKFVKQYRLDIEEIHTANLREYTNEAAFLGAPPKDFKAPRLFLHGRSEREAWLVREHIDGRLLSDLILAGEPINAQSILREVLKQLAVMERAGFYHDDLRAWNIVAQKDGQITLIDYGAISTNCADCGWPYNIFLSFVIFVHEIVHGHITKRHPLPAAKLNPLELPEPYRSIIWKMYDMPASAWSFEYLLRQFEMTEHPVYDLKDSPQTGLVLAFIALASACEGDENKKRLESLDMDRDKRTILKKIIR